MNGSSESSDCREIQPVREVVNGNPPLATGEIASTGGPENTLTPEEQMALYEKELKENDWGHQPC